MTQPQPRNSRSTDVLKHGGTTSEHNTTQYPFQIFHRFWLAQIPDSPITFAISGKMTSTVNRQKLKLERQTKSLEGEVALAQLFSSPLVAGEKVAKFSFHDLQRGNKGTKKEKQQNQYSSTDGISAIRENICLTKHLLSWVPEVFSRLRQGAFDGCGPRENRLSI